MQCPTINELPPPNLGKSGWPWTEECAQLPARLPDGCDWPRISIILVSFNRAQFIEETIRSVLLQGYPNLEFIIMDGASTDGTFEIIKQYEKWLGCFVSEPDRGPVHAANKAFDRMTGSLFGWLGSDDLMLKGALAAVALAHREHPDRVIAADAIDYDEMTGREHLVEQRNLSVQTFVEFWKRDIKSWSAIGLFTPVSLQRRVGRLDERLPYSCDYDFYVRVLSLGAVHYLRHRVARFRMHADSRTSGETRIFGDLELARKNPEYSRLVENFDFGGFKRFVRYTLAADLFYWGVRRLRQGKPGGFKLIATGLRINPFTAVLPILRNFFRKVVSAGWKGGA